MFEPSLVQSFDQRTSSDFNRYQPKHRNRNFLKTFLQPFVMKCVYIKIQSSFDIILDIPITKLTEL